MLAPSTTVLFQGDSITNAFRMPHEVCNAYQLGAGYAMIVASHLLATRAQDGLTFHNRGIGGDGISNLRNRWQVDCLDLRPDLLSILVGVNDAQVQAPAHHTPIEVYAATYRELLASTRQALPTVQLVLCEPFVLKVGVVTDAGIATVAALADVVRSLAREHDAVLVPLSQVFQQALSSTPDEYWSFDGIHPNAQGHWLIAQAWLDAVVRQPV